MDKERREWVEGISNVDVHKLKRVRKGMNKKEYGTIRIRQVCYRILRIMPTARGIK